MTMIPRPLIAAALGLPADTDALPQGDLPMDRFMARFIAYLQSENPATDTPDAWTGTVMDHLIESEPELALSAIKAGLPIDPDGLLADALADLGERPSMKTRIEAEAAENAELAELLSTGD